MKLPFRLVILLLHHTCLFVFTFFSCMNVSMKRGPAFNVSDGYFLVYRGAFWEL